MDWMQTGITLLTVLIGSGLIQWYFARKDKQKEDAKKDSADAIKKEMSDHLTEVNKQWKSDYCDKNTQAIQLLREEVISGLDDREKRGSQRFEEHQLAIEKMNLEHQKDFQELKQAIQLLTENDTKITESITKIADKQDVIADSLIGQAHDRIIFLTDKISQRGAITLKEKATLTSMYEPYRKLGGNGLVSTSVHHVESLTVVSDDEARGMDIKIKNKQREIV